MATDKEASCLSCASDPNFAVICSFLDKFSSQCGITYPSFAELQGMLEDTQTVSQVLIDLHVKLLRKARKSFTADKWEKALAKFCHTYSQQDGWELERFGYKKARLEVKVKLLKVLLETQFDVNAKFKSEVNKLPPADLRLEPLGRDQTGLTYWCQFDPSSNIRVYREDVDEESWELIAKDRDGLVKLIDSLSNGEGQQELNNILNEDSASQEIEKPITDTGQNGVKEEGEEVGVHEEGEENGVQKEGLENGVPEEGEGNGVQEEDEGNGVKEEGQENEDLEEEEEEEEVDNDDVEEEEEEEEELEEEAGVVKEENKEEVKEANIIETIKETKKEYTCIQDNAVNGNVITIKNKLVENGVNNSSQDTNESSLSGVDLSVKPEPRNYSANSKQGSFYMMPDRDPLPETADILSQMSMRFNEKRFAEDLRNPNKKPRTDIVESDIDQNQPIMLVKKSYKINEISDEPLSLVSGATIQRVKEDSNSQPPVSEAIEERVQYVTGPGSGAECNDGQPGYFHEETDEEPEFSEVIEEPILYIRGEGSGADCDVGNLGRSDEPHCSSSNMSSKFLVSRKEIALHEGTFEKGKPKLTFSEVVEEEVVYIKGLGSGADCDVGNPKQFSSDIKEHSPNSPLVPEFSNVIEEPVHYVQGNGSGAECGVGSPRHVRDQSRIANSESFATMGIECSMNNMSLSEFEHTFSEVIEEPVMFVHGCGNGQDCLTGNDEKEETPPDQSSNLSKESVGTRTEINSNEPSLLKSLSEVKPAEENIPMKDKPPDFHKLKDDEKKLDHLSNSVQDTSKEKLNSKLTTSHLEDNNVDNNSISCNNNVNNKPSESSDQVSSKQNYEDCADSEESVSEKSIEANTNIFPQNESSDLNNSNLPLKKSSNGIVTENGPSKDDLNSSEKIKKEISEENCIIDNLKKEKVNNLENNINNKKSNMNLSGDIKPEIKCEIKTEDDKIKKEASEKMVKKENNSLVKKEYQEIKDEEDNSDLEDEDNTINEENNSKKEENVAIEKDLKTKKNVETKEKKINVDNENVNPKKKCDSDNEENDPKNKDSEEDNSDEKGKNKNDSKEENTNEDSKQIGKGRKSRTNSLNDENDTDIPNKKPKTDTSGKTPARRSLRRTVSSNSQPNEAKKVQNKKETKKTETVDEDEEDKDKSNKKNENEQDKGKSNKKNEKKDMGKNESSLSNFSMEAPDEDGPVTGKPLKNQNRKRRSSMRLSRSEEEGGDVQEDEEEEVGGKKPRLKGIVKKTKGKLIPSKPPPPESSSEEEENEEGEDEDDDDDDDDDDDEEEKCGQNDKKVSKQAKGKGRSRPPKRTRSVRSKTAAATAKKRKSTQQKKSKEENIKESNKKSPKKAETTPTKKGKVEVKRKGNETKKVNDSEATKKKGKVLSAEKKSKKVTPTKKGKPKESVEDESDSEDENRDENDDNVDDMKQEKKVVENEEENEEKGEVNEESDIKTEDQDESTPKKEEKKSRVRRKSSKKKTLLGLTEWDLAHTKKVQEAAGLESADGGNVRASRRIAQIKIKEEAERRAIEEATILPGKIKKKQKKPEEKKESPKKTKKRKGKGERSSEEDETFKEPKEEKKRKKKRKGLKFNENKPWMSSSGSSSEEVEDEDDHFEEEEDEEDIRQKKIVSDHEFSPESDLEKDDEGVEGAPQPVRRARTAKKGKAESEVEDEEEKEEEQAEDYPCKKCGLPNHPEWILLCDKCDSGYHASCLRPPLMLIPEGDWFCPPCQHADLVVKLREALRTFEKDTKKRENEELRRKRLAYVGISLANVLPTPEKREGGHHRRQIRSSTEEYSSEEETESSDEEPVYQLRQRRAAVQANYRFNDYDELINSAIQEEMDAVKGAGNMGRGKDIQNIVEAEKNVPEENVEKEDAEEEEEGENWRPRVVPKITALPSLRKKPKKITDLDDIPSDDDGSDEDFKGSSAEEYSTSGGGDSDDSVVMIPVRRSERTRQSRIDREFINDDSDSSDEPRRKKTRKLYASSSSDSSGSWGGRRKRKSKSYSRIKSSRTKKKSTRYFDSDDSDRPKKVKPKRPKIRYGLSEDDEPVKTRTRGKKVSYLDVAGSDTEEEVIRRSRKLPSEDEDEFVPEKDDEEEEVKVKKKVISSTEEEESEEESEGESNGEEKAEETTDKRSASEKTVSSAAEEDSLDGIDSPPSHENHSQSQNPKPEIEPPKSLPDNQNPLKDMKQPAVIVERIKSIDSLGQRSIASEDDDEVEEEEIEEEIEEEVEEEEEEEIDEEPEAAGKLDLPKDLAMPKPPTDEALEMKKELERKGVTLMAVKPTIAPQQPTSGYRPNQIPMGIRPPFAPSIMVGRPPFSQPPVLIRPPHSQPMPARPPPTQPPVVVHSSRMQPSVLVPPPSAQALLMGQAPPPPRAIPVRAPPQPVSPAQLISKAPSPIQPVSSVTPPQPVSAAPSSQPVSNVPAPQSVLPAPSQSPSAPPPSQSVPSAPPTSSASSSPQKTSIKSEPSETKKEEKEEKKEPVPTIRLVPSAKLIDPNKARRPLEEGVIRGMLGGGGYYRPPHPQQRVGQPTLPPAGYSRQRFPEPHQRYGMYQPPHQLPPSHQFYPQAGYYPGGSGEDYGSGYDDGPPAQAQVIPVGGGGEEDGVFSGLVSYFSSQREDPLDS